MQAIVIIIFIKLCKNKETSMQFNFDVSPTIIFGMKKIDEIGNLISDFKSRKTMIVCDKAMLDLGFVEKVSRQLDLKGINYCIFDKVLPNPTDILIDEASNFAKENNIDSLIAIGGGSVMDSAKAINILLTNGGQISDYAGVNMVKNPVLPLILIPTTSGTASEVTSVSVITDTSNHKKMVIAGQYVCGNIALCDPALTLNLPKDISASTGMDALTHAIEAYVSKLASPITDTLALKSIELIMTNLEEAVDSGSEKSRSEMMLGSTMAGIAFNSALLGLVHSLAHPLSAHYNTPHGVANAIFLPAIVEYNMDSIGEKRIPLAKAMKINTSSLKDEEVSKAIVKKLDDLSTSINIPTLASLNISKEDFPMLASDAMKEFSTMTNPKETSQEDLIKIMENASIK